MDGIGIDMGRRSTGWRDPLVIVTYVGKIIIHGLFKGGKKKSTSRGFGSKKAEFKDYYLNTYILILL